MPPKTRNPDHIVKMVNMMEAQNHSVRDRMDADMDLYRLTPYQGEEELDNYRKFTSNDPRTAMNLAIHLASTAQVRYVVHQPQAQRPQRGINNQKELFIIGSMHAVDERRAKLLTPPLIDAMAVQCLLRGRRAHRVLLIKEDIERDELIDQEFQRFQQMGLDSFLEEPPESTRTYIDITDWDPRNTYWGMGRHGLAWACHKVKKTRTELCEEYNLNESDLPDKGDPEMYGEADSRYLSDDEPDYAIYDYFDEENNVVVLENGVVLKEPTPHGMGRVPVSIGIVGSLPFLQAEGDDYASQYGESLYNADRLMFDQNNFMLSIMAELTKRSIHQPLVLHSRDGSLSLEGDPRESGAEVSLSSQNEEAIEPLPPMEMVKESAAFMSTIQTMMQRGAFPYTAFGELAFQLSGYAINSLRQGMEVPIMPTVKSMITGLKEIGDILCDAYATGAFDPLTLSGKLQTPTRSYFSQEITPEMVQEAGTLEVTITPQLPQDDQTKVQLAAMASSGELPLVDMRFAREHYLGLQDVDAIERAVFEQIGMSASPVALAFNMMKSSAEQGDMEQAELYMIEFETLLMQKYFELMASQQMIGQAQGQGQPGQGGMGGLGGGLEGPPGSGSPEGGNFSPDVQPSQAAGTPQANTSPGPGPQVPPGTPRPGAQQNPGMEGPGQGMQ